MLPYDVVQHILSFVHASKSKRINKKSHALYAHEARTFFIKRWFPRCLASRLYSEAVVDIGERMGTTGYIDFIREKDLSQTRRGFGVDMCRRPFVTVCGKNGIVTLFQRYSDDRRKWTFGGRGDTILSPGTVLYFGYGEEKNTIIMDRFWQLWDKKEVAVIVD